VERGWGGTSGAGDRRVGEAMAGGEGRGVGGVASKATRTPTATSQGAHGWAGGKGTARQLVWRRRWRNARGGLGLIALPATALLLATRVQHNRRRLAARDRGGPARDTPARRRAAPRPRGGRGTTTGRGARRSSKSTDSPRRAGLPRQAPLSGPSPG